MFNIRLPRVYWSEQIALISRFCPSKVNVVKVTFLILHIFVLFPGDFFCFVCFFGRVEKSRPQHSYTANFKKKNVSEKSFQNACNIPQIVFKRHFHKLPLYLKRGKAIEVQELLLYSVIVNGDFSSRWGDICKEDSETGGILFKFYNALQSGLHTRDQPFLMNQKRTFQMF